MPRREIAPGRTCLECRRRKIKCDRSHPCSYCVKVRIHCQYPPPRPSHGSDVDGRGASLGLKSPAAEKFPSAVGATSSRAWNGSYPARDIDSVQVSLLQDSFKSLMAGSSHSPAGNRSSSLLRPKAAIDLKAVRPPLALAMLLWQQYLDLVDPLLKIFHTPSVQQLVIRANCSQEKLDATAECLLFAIYYAAVAAMSPLACKTQLEGERGILLMRHRIGVEYLLSRLDLLNSTDMTVLQAFTLYLITGRCDQDGPDVYALVGLATGMALKMGLNQDGEALEQPPFEVEMRRRLWWQLFILDTRAAEDRQSEPCILESSFNTRLPSNIGDADLHPQMSRHPVCGQNRTEMLYSLVRFEGSYFARQMVFSDGFDQANAYISLSTKQKRHAIDLFQERIETQYLTHCDDGIPMDKITKWSIRLILDKLRLAAIDEIAPEDARQRYIKLLQDASELRKYEGGQQWLWLSQTYIEWDALACLLQGLQADTVEGEHDEGWHIARDVYSYWKNHESVRRDRRWDQIERLSLEVFVTRARRP